MPSHYLKKARRFAQLMDNQFEFMGLRFGVDSITGFIPGVGDVLGLSLSCYLIWIAIQMDLPPEKVGRIIFNILIDAIIGGIPLIGDLGDIFYKANLQNLRIIEEHELGEVIEGEVIQD